ncbi:MAG: hypothetical protein K5656_10530 [Lachnospiraceae bacterium]|nr:hypothetical protein [Lachnospiraceae bacterium]
MKNKKGSVSMTVTGVIIVILSAVLVISILAGIVSLVSRNATKRSSTDDLLRYIADENYDTLLHAYYDDNDNINETDERKNECWAIARYYQYGIEYKAFYKSNNSEKAAFYKEKMDKEEAMMGELKSYKASVDDFLAIE